MADNIKRHILVISHAAIDSGLLSDEVNEEKLERAERVVEDLDLKFDLVAYAELPAAEKTFRRLAPDAEVLLPITSLNPEREVFQRAKVIWDDLGMLAGMEAFCNHPDISLIDDLAGASGDELDKMFFEREVYTALVVVFPPLTNLLSMWFRCGVNGISEFARENFLTANLSSSEGFLLQDYYDNGSWMMGTDGRFPDN